MNHRPWESALALALCLVLALAEGSAQQKSGVAALVERGKALVQFGGCNDCHSPKVMTPEGPAVDMAKPLSGSPSSGTLPEVPNNVLGPEKWGAMTTNDMTAWVGPWGVSFAANLTPDKNTGLGNWTEAMFIKALRTGKHMGEGRGILPPMPWDGIRTLKDEDLKAIFAYLRTLKPINNPVHDPIPPPESMMEKK